MDNKTETVGRLSWTQDELLSSLDQFQEVYARRPLLDNFGGMTSTHMFYTWFVIRKLKPKYIVESGVWYGLGTWLLKEASPGSKVYSLDVDFSHLKVRLSGVTYIGCDFTLSDWNTLIPIADHEDTVLFFDDHQNAIKRISHIVERQYGFKTMMFEDNYPVGQGDCISLKQSWVNDRGNDALRKVKTYHEFPPIFTQKKTRWGTDWLDHETKDPVLKTVETDWHKTLYDESGNYTWICYVELV